MADIEAKKILTGKWADLGDRTDPDDGSLSLSLIRTIGWPASFSASDGDTVRREVINQLLRELNGAAVDGMLYGIGPYDADLNYRQHDLCQVAGTLYRAIAVNGPDTSNETSPADVGQSLWEGISGEQALPSAPSAPQAATPKSGELDWFWNCPLDGGAQVTEFDFRWRLSGTQAWSAVDSVTTARKVLTGLSNGAQVQAQVLARTTNGDSPWSATGSATPAGTVPGGGSTLALRATGGDTEVDLDWLEPDDGGVAISAYLVQWRTGNQSFSSGRQTSVTATEETVGSLVNDTEYFFRVRAVNGEGNGAWSNEDSATPEAAVVVPQPDPDTEPDALTDAPTGTVNGQTILWEWEIPDDNGQRISSFDIQWREQGNNWSGNVVRVESSCYNLDGLAEDTTYEARVRARNSIGVSAWSSTGDASTPAVGSNAEFLSGQGTQSFAWPWNTARGLLILRAGGGGGGGSGAIGNARGDDADDGDDTTVTVLATTHTARGGGGGRGGGAAGRSSDDTTAGTRGANGNPNYDGGGRGGFGAAGIRAFGGFSNSDSGDGGNGGMGELVYVELDGLSIGDVFSIVVGDGGSGGDGGDSVFDPGSNGVAGFDGEVRIVPLY